MSLSCLALQCISMPSQPDPLKTRAHSGHRRRPRFGKPWLQAKHFLSDTGKGPPR
jgi:hypothetical protein